MRSRYMETTMGNPVYLSFIIDMVNPYYNEPHRSYHSWQHIDRMLSAWHTNEHLQKRIPCLSNAQTVAIIFHDLVYVPGSPNNEIDSITILRSLARHQSKAFGGLLTKSEMELVEKIILSTKSPHIPLCKEAELVVDLDMLGFSFSRPEYLEGNLKIENEFRFLDGFAHARLIFLNSMLARKPFFYTPCFKSFEEVAYANIRKDIEDATKES